MNCIVLRLIRLFLSGIFVLGSVLTHAGSVVHAAPGGFGVAHEHVSHAEAPTASLFGQSSTVDFADPSKDDPGHVAGFCLDAHCCTPAVHMAAQDGLSHTPEGDELAIGTASNYALSLARSLLRPPRSIA